MASTSGRRACFYTVQALLLLQACTVMPQTAFSTQIESHSTSFGSDRQQAAGIDGQAQRDSHGQAAADANYVQHAAVGSSSPPDGKIPRTGVFLQDDGAINSKSPWGPRKALRVPAFPGTYGMQAVYNLSQFRTNLLAVNARLFNQRPAFDQDRQYARYDMYQPIVTCPPGRPLQRVGPGTGEDKLLCAVQNLTAPCVIYSLGSRMEFDFEQEMLRSTACEVHTFDCTVPGRTIHPIRHHFHTVCIGNEPPKPKAPQNDSSTPAKPPQTLYGPYESFPSITSRLGHSRISLLKMDIEGYEFEALADLKESNPALPEQIAVELHFDSEGKWADLVAGVAAKNQLQMSLLFMHMSSLGYAVVAREDNPWNMVGCCSEYTFLQVEQLTANRAAWSVIRRQQAAQHRLHGNRQNVLSERSRLPKPSS